jgi:hypothetical protein
VRYGSREVTRTLLPFEAELRDLLGLSDEEYFAFIDACAERAGYRPAEYDHIPDVQNGPLVPILISLAVGAALTAVGALLAPKPQLPEQITNKAGTNRTGSDRFAPRYGFDSVASLANLGEAVPIVWTFYTGYSGGVVFEPKLVWSKVYSWGTQQSIKLLYVVSEGGGDRPQLPERAGIWFGNNALNILQDRDFAFWYSTAGEPSGSPRYGTADGTRTSGDPSSGYGGDTFPRFSQGYTPSNSTTFGVAHAIPNGTHYRVQWRTISRPSALDGDAKRRASTERFKICGYRDTMKGVGMGYPRRQGLINSNTFMISGMWLKRNIFRDDVGVDDINSALDGECEAADDLMQLGESFISGGTVYQVQSRSLQIWQKPQMEDGGKAINLESPNQYITLKQVETVWSGVGAGVLSEPKVQGRGPISRDAQPFGEFDNPQPNVGGGHYPFCLFTSAEIRNTRPCDVTEIGIRSTIWGRFNGIVNFNEIPSPSQLNDLDNDNVSVQSGQMNLYFTRTSLFTVFIRVAGSSQWQESRVLFAVRGCTQQAQYNSIRFNHPGRGDYEFRLVPLPGTVALRDLSQTVYVLNANAAKDSSDYGIRVSMPLGIQALAYGKPERVEDIAYDRLTWSDPFSNTASSAWQKYIPDKARYVAGVIGDPGRANKKSAALFTVLGYPSQSGGTRGAVVITTGKKNNGEHLEAAIFFVCDPVRDSKGVWTWSDPRDVQPYNEEDADKYWNTAWGTKPQLKSYNSATWPQTDGKEMLFTAKILPFQNPFYDWDGGSYEVSLKFNVWSAKQETEDGKAESQRKFEFYTSFIEVSHYGTAVTRSCDNGPEHAITYVNEIRDSSPTFNKLAMCGVSLKSNRSFTSADQVRLYIRSGINSSNSFPGLVRYMLQNSAQGLAAGMIDEASFASAEAFCNQHRLHFDGVLAERTNLRSFVTTTAPMFLLNLVIANGQLALRPAIPSGATALFTQGNIVDGSLQVTKLDTGERRPFRAVMVWRTNPLNELPRTRTVTAYWTDRPNAPMEEYDISSFCTQESHALLAARYLLAVRRYVTRTVTFKTTPDQARIQPGDLINLAIEQVAISRMAAGAVLKAGEITSTVPIEDGTYNAVIYQSGDDHVTDVKLTVAGGKVTTPEHWGKLFALRVNTISSNPYIVEEIKLDEDGLVDISASEFPSTISGAVFGGSGIAVDRE